MQVQLKEVKGNIHNMDDECERMRKEKDKLQKERNTMETDLAEKEAHIKKLDSNNSRLTNIKVALEQNITKLQEENAIIRNKIESLQKEMGDLLDDIMQQNLKKKDTEKANEIVLME